MILKKKTLYIVIIAVAAVVAGYLFLRGKSEDEKSINEPSTMSVKMDESKGNAPSAALPGNKQGNDVPVKVKAEKVIIGDLVKRVSAYGNAEAVRLVKIAPETSGKVLELSVREGDRVKKGDILFRLDDADTRLKLKQAKDREITAYSRFLIQEMDYNGVSDDRKRSVEEAKNKLKEAEQRFADRLITKNEYENIKRACELTLEAASLDRNEVVKSSTGLTAARLDVETAELELAKKTVRAPFGGAVTDIKIVEGKNVSAGEETLTLVDNANIRIVAEVLENEIPALKVGRKVKIDFLALEGKIYEGAIDAISPIIDPQKKTGKVIVNIPNRDFNIKPGMYARIRLDAHIFSDRLLVPRSAVLERDGKRLVFIIKNDRAQWEYVKTGLENEEYIEIIPDPDIGIHGVHKGDIVITDGHFSLAHDVKVRY